MDRFRAYRVFQDGDTVQGRLVEVGLPDLADGDVVVRVAYSGVNYKDALAATGAGRIMRRFPLVGGVDLAGTVETSGDPRFAPGDEVLATGFGLGESHDGGFAEYARVPAGLGRPPSARARPARGNGDRHGRIHGRPERRRDGTQRLDPRQRRRDRDRRDGRRGQPGGAVPGRRRLPGHRVHPQGGRARVPAVARSRGRGFPPRSRTPPRRGRSRRPPGRGPSTPSAARRWPG